MVETRTQTGYSENRLPVLPAGFHVLPGSSTAMLAETQSLKGERTSAMPPDWSSHFSENIRHFEGYSIGK
jgi:hypothetical protein